MELIKNLPGIHFEGDEPNEEIDWRAEVDDEEEDDEELEEDAPASNELIELLGFDPDEEEDDD